MFALTSSTYYTDLKTRKIKPKVEKNGNSGRKLVCGCGSTLLTEQNQHIYVRSTCIQMVHYHCMYVMLTPKGLIITFHCC